MPPAKIRGAKFLSIFNSGWQTCAGAASVLVDLVRAVLSEPPVDVVDRGGRRPRRGRGVLPLAPTDAVIRAHLARFGMRALHSSTACHVEQGKACATTLGLNEWHTVAAIVLFTRLTTENYGIMNIVGVAPPAHRGTAARTT